MKNSYKIIIALSIVLVIGVGLLGIYQYNSNNKSSDDIGQVSTENTETQNSEDQENSGQESDEGIIPLAHIFEFDNVLYVTETVSEHADVIDAKTLPVESERFAVIDGNVYYITVGNEEFAPELRVCDLDGNDDKSITEFVSPLGSPAVVGNYLYSAYYGVDSNDENAGIFRVDLTKSDDDMTYEKIADGEYYIYGYDNEYIYYAANDASTGTVLYRMTLNGENGTEILNFKSKSDNIVIDKKYVFFSAYDDISHSYKIYRSPKDGRGNIDAYSFECLNGQFDVIDNRLYYQADSSIYSSELNGNDETKVISLEENSLYAYNFLKFGDILYFYEKQNESYSDIDVMFRLDMTTAEKSNISR
ncbi:MAG: DUF5050 domain-containing protein [Clostridiales bacterium]|nr:DUF5050 domain-containing protein [Clostridiales bacterium]